MSVEKQFYGKTKDNIDIDKYIIKNKDGASAQIITYGATLDKLFVKDKNGRLDDILLGFDNITDHEELSDYQGVIVGRYANRIKKGKFSIDGVEYSVKINNNGNCNHGGNEFSEAVWDAEITGENSVKFTYFSPDGTCGFPGNMKVGVTYTLTDDDCLRIDFEGVSDKKTIMNFTNHAYFNLGGYASGDILGHLLKIDADFYTPTDETSIPTGELKSVENTPFDFRTPKPIGKDIRANDQQLLWGKGYDINFCINSPSIEKPCAVVCDPVSGRKMEVYSDLPGLQLYSGCLLDNVKGKNGTFMNQYEAFCLETQFWPDSPNRDDFPNCVFDKDEVFKTTTVFKFSI
ncbi:MAG: galactose mutarotase [Clostridia bacterium]|nr:galactose mutarotase [Clostridia bacterium]